ncbi:MAG: hypothetical protein A2Y84_01710 [Candidatus Colwellbacteria bacterium RBG_13_48_8]|uniref:Small ribosomal subunit protein bS21 n=1 Tax=Candidatus Colwellbacteria bacterium RBG_13_48_8 TaxID=1797685 RepID=A0A1G1YZK0_9BACT|nr:MAG: hypothetical protein A2Y84_01710 [Candidatus Colwellbacteria bacterium RBG_13_48_8]
MANITLRKKEGESNSSLVYRFSKKVVQSGVLKEVKKHRFHPRNVNRRKRRASALHRERRKLEVEKAKRLGTPRF